MDFMNFEWDADKAKINFEKHGVSFEEAITVFDDYNSILFDDPDHSFEENRFILLGISVKSNILIVCHCIRKKETVIRIISARKATKSEREQYIELLGKW